MLHWFNKQGMRMFHTGWAESMYTVIIYYILYTYFWPNLYGSHTYCIRMYKAKVPQIAVVSSTYNTSCYLIYNYFFTLVLINRTSETPPITKTKQILQKLQLY